MHLKSLETCCLFKVALSDSREKCGNVQYFHIQYTIGQCLIWLLYPGQFEDFPTLNTLDSSHEGFNKQLISAQIENDQDEEQNGAVFSWRLFVGKYGLLLAYLIAASGLNRTPFSESTEFIMTQCLHSLMILQFEKYRLKAIVSVGNISRNVHK